MTVGMSGKGIMGHNDYLLKITSNIYIYISLYIVHIYVCIYIYLHNLSGNFPSGLTSLPLRNIDYLIKPQH